MRPKESTSEPEVPGRRSGSGGGKGDGASWTSWLKSLQIYDATTAGDHGGQEE
jgi:hypothetical protein